MRNTEAILLMCCLVAVGVSSDGIRGRCRWQGPPADFNPSLAELCRTRQSSTDLGKVWQSLAKPNTKYRNTKYQIPNTSQQKMDCTRAVYHQLISQKYLTTLKQPNERFLENYRLCKCIKTTLLSTRKWLLIRALVSNKQLRGIVASIHSASWSERYVFDSSTTKNAP